MLGELDALVVAGHPEADAETGAAHACGHNAQIAGLLGAAMGLVDAKVSEHLAGRVAFFAVPAEEYGDIAWRVEQRREGTLEFLGGKPELLRLGHFDDVQLAMMIHTTSRSEDGKAGVPTSNNGCIVKTVRYAGKAAHAGGAPHLGVNALYAATIGLSAINAIRETFRDEDTIRVHPIVTHGGSQVNVIPADVRIETYVRGRTVEAIVDAERKVDRALKAGALALGATVEIETLPGYLPMQCDAVMTRYFKETAAALVGAEHYRQIGHRTGSTDMGDLSQVMPILHPYLGGARGSGHGADFAIVDTTWPTCRWPRRWRPWWWTCWPTVRAAPGGAGPGTAEHDARGLPGLPARAGAPRDLLGLRPRPMYGPDERRVSDTHRLPHRGNDRDRLPGRGGGPCRRGSRDRAEA